MKSKNDSYDTVASFLIELGWKILEKPELEDNYFDMTAISDKKSLRIEIKTLLIKPNGSWQVERISENQQKADAVAVIFPNGSVFLEKMEDYLKNCSDGGYRQFTWLRP